MIDIVCPLGSGSLAHNMELKYSLRSLEKYGQNVGNVFLIGECPKWIKNVIHIPCGEHGTHHERNIMEKFRIACNDERVGENFLKWNDDYFLLDKIDCENYPYYSMKGKSLIDGVNARMKYDGYAMSLDNSRKHLEAKGFPSLHYDIHCPIIYNKKLFLEYVCDIDWTIPQGYTLKSLYGNQIQNVNKQPFIELKINKISSLIEIKLKTKGRHIFSISDAALGYPMKMFLEMTYPQKSRYEK